MNAQELMAEDGLWAEAWRPVKDALDRHAHALYDEGGRFPAWTLQLGKGGPGYAGPEISLYRHCMDVLHVATEQLFERWRVGRLPTAGPEDNIGFRDALSALMGVALAHDANKYVGADSHSPTLDEVRVVAADLNMGSWMPDAPWAGFTAEKLHAAVSRVENRGLGMALLGPSIPPVLEAIADAVHEGDNLVSRASGPARFVELYNERRDHWRTRYGIDVASRRLLTWHDEPPVLFGLQQVVLDVLYASGSLPLVLWRDGSVLYAGVPDDIDISTILEWFHGWAADVQPSVRFDPPSGAVNLLNVSNLDELHEALESADWPGSFLTVPNEELPAISGYAQWWLLEQRDDAGALRVARDPGSGRRQTLLGRVRGKVPPTAFRRALVCACLLVKKEQRQRALEVDGGRLRRDLEGTGIDLNGLSDLGSRTLIALHAGLTLSDDTLGRWVSQVGGPFPPRAVEPAGIADLVAQLGAQVGMGGAPEGEDPYAGARLGGACLLCGHPSDTLIEAKTMELLGVKASAFNSRVGRPEDPSANKATNFICRGCVERQRLWVRLRPLSRTTTGATVPLVVATPLTSWLHEVNWTAQPGDTSTVQGQPGMEWLPWNRTTRESLALGWREQPRKLEEAVGLMDTLARYAAASGEPVRAFVHGQHDQADSLYYEPLSNVVGRLLDRAGLLTERGGVLRGDLPRLLGLLAAFGKLLGGDMRGREAFQLLDAFGWWVAADLWMPRLLPGAERVMAAERDEMTRYLAVLRGGFPMVEDVQLRALANRVAELQRIYPSERSQSHWTFVIRSILDGVSAYRGFATSDALVEALATDLERDLARGNLIRNDIRRQEGGHTLVGEQCRSIVRDVLALVASLAGENGRPGTQYRREPYETTANERRFLIAAYQGFLWEALRHRDEQTSDNEGEELEA